MHLQIVSASRASDNTRAVCLVSIDVNALFANKDSSGGFSWRIPGLQNLQVVGEAGHRRIVVAEQRLPDSQQGDFLEELLVEDVLGYLLYNISVFT